MVSNPIITSLSHAEICRKCVDVIKEYTKEKASFVSEEQKVKFVINQDKFQETYKLHLQGQGFTFRVKGKFTAHNMAQANEVIQKVSFYATTCQHLMNKDDGEDLERAKAPNKRKLDHTSTDSKVSHTELSKKNVKLDDVSDLLKKQQMRRRKNLQKAFAEHKKSEEVSVIFSKTSSGPLVFNISQAEDKGHRPEMEDVGFCKENDTGILAGVFDGHCDKGLVSNRALQHFEKHFFNELKSKVGQITDVFESLMEKIHCDVASLHGGTTAGVCYIDKLNHYLYMATLGDSESMVFRKQGEKFTWLPVSCVRNWSSLKDSERAVKGLENLKIYFDIKKYPLDYTKFLNIENWRNLENPKKLRFPPNSLGINVSRSIGDHNNIKQWNSTKILSHKPKVTEFLLCPEEGIEDCIVIGSDGIWDYIKSMDRFLVDVLKPNWGAKNLASVIINYIKEEFKTGRDNATAICIYTHLSSQQ